MSRWSDKQDLYLCKLVKKNIINYNNLKPNYLFGVTQEHLLDFIGTGASARLAAIQRLCKKIRQLSENFAINRRRLSGELGVRVRDISYQWNCHLLTRVSFI
jgi:hypothetical protein